MQWSGIIRAWTYKCPRCRIGKIFTEPFEITKPLEMPYACDHCGQKTEPEPGFYYGAMIVSYVLSIFLIFPVGLFMIFYVGWSINAGMAFIIFLSLISFIRILRYSRAIWLHLLVKYDPKYNNP